MSPEAIIAFLADLTKLTLQHKIAIGGCNCCHSPFLEDEPRRGFYTTELSHEEHGNLTWQPIEPLTLADLPSHLRGTL